MRVELLAETLHFAVAFAAALAATRLLESFARRIGWVDRPSGRKAHASAVPLTGGLAIVSGVAAVCVADPSVPPLLRGLGGGALVLLAAGIGDDLFDLPWPLRLGLQAVAVLAMIHWSALPVPYADASGAAATFELQRCALPFSVLASVGVLNAFNMADGGDGIAAAMALAALTLFGVACLAAGSPDIVSAIVVLAGAIGGFFALNMRFPWQPHARAFLGDAGSNLIGLGIVWVALRASAPRAPALDPALAPWFVAPPLVDGAVTILRRLRRRRSPFRADRDHLHHLLLDAGLAPSLVAWLLGASTLAFGGLALAASRLGAPPGALIAAFVVLVVAHAALTSDRARFIAHVRRRQRREDVRGEEPVAR